MKLMINEGEGNNKKNNKQFVDLSSTQHSQHATHLLISVQVYTLLYLTWCKNHQTVITP